MGRYLEEFPQSLVLTITEDHVAKALAAKGLSRSQTCPVAQALGQVFPRYGCWVNFIQILIVGKETSGPADLKAEYYLSPEVRSFIDYFDKGLLNQGLEGKVSSFTLTRKR